MTIDHSSIAQDTLTLVLRLFAENYDSHSPETLDVLRRWTPALNALMGGKSREEAIALVVSETGIYKYAPSEWSLACDGRHYLAFNKSDRCWFTAYTRIGKWYHACGDGSERYELRSVTHFKLLPEEPQ